MMLRLHLGDTDITRIRIKPGAAPLTEMALSVETLQSRTDRIVLGAWRSAVRAAASPQWRTLTELVRPDHLWPEFLAPRSRSPRIDDSLELLRSTSLPRVRAAMTRLARLRPLSARTTPLVRGDADSLARLADVAAQYFDVAVAPHWARIRTCVEADIARRARILASGGVQDLLTTLHPTVIWRPPILHVPSHMDADIHLSGQGLTLVPSFFNRTTAFAVPDTTTPLLIYPVALDVFAVATIWQSTERTGGLATLLGRTRANALRAIATGCTTTELARRIGVSPASASEHAAVLRQASLTTTQRHRNYALHTITQLGLQLLESEQNT